ncbi:MAG TPA: isoprenylcysteine carboxylmethyltransferase family protein [Blastocatellia bacterium]|jgi:protein-S-isoprenylcysteine O-methyltransferase Ste14|nr:isoprenylcysteine carboxylmethyltransferase family protein [Blastocatellia bacterium]
MSTLPADSHSTPRKTATFVVRFVIGLIFFIAAFGVVLFLGAGTFRWWRGWVFLGVLLVAYMITMLVVLRDREEILNERFKPPIQEGQPFLDKILTVVLIAGFLGLIVFIPLDVFRLQLMGGPGLVIAAIGLALLAAGWWIMSLALRDNPFAAPVVRHQEERNQRVVDSGVYSVVRHPMYAGAVLLFIGMPLWLGSYAGVLLALLPIATLVLRILLEERFLKRELRGYDAYTKRVRHRLIPPVW